MAHGSHGGKVTSALFALTMTLVACLTGVFLLVQSVFPWMTVFNQNSTGEVAAPSRERVLDATKTGPTPAERTLRKVMGVKVPGVAADGWAEVRASGGVPGVSFGFGCDPTDGFAPVVAEARSWVQSRADSNTTVARAVGTLDVSARAYPAGGGAVAFAGLTDAVVRCEAASLYPASGVGVEAMQVMTAKTASLVWRRGDVLMVGTVTRNGHAGQVGDQMGVFGVFDTALKEALATVCTDPSAGAQDARRSPYLNRKQFTGNRVKVTVHRKKHPKALTAEDRTTDPVVPIPGPHIVVPYVSSLPSPPAPAPTKGPTVLPAPVGFPTEPAVPSVRPTNAMVVDRKVDDPDGPGCGWAFTGQVAPRFDKAAAASAYESAVQSAQRSMSIAWKRWEDAKVDYYSDYAAYVKAAKQYKRYAAEVAEVSAAWATVEAARSAYSTALAQYNAAVDALAQWKTDRAQARAEYKAAKKACRHQHDDETEGPSPDEPGASPSASESPTGEPEEPEMVCPPVRPTILDQTPPTVPVSPVPADAAQLPKPEKNTP